MGFYIRRAHPQGVLQGFLGACHTKDASANAVIGAQGKARGAAKPRRGPALASFCALLKAF